MRRPCFPVGSVRKEEPGCRFDDGGARERPTAGGFGRRFAGLLARTGDAFLAMAAHDPADDGRYDEWRIR